MVAGAALVAGALDPVLSPAVVPEPAPVVAGGDASSSPPHAWSNGTPAPSSTPKPAVLPMNCRLVVAIRFSPLLVQRLLPLW